MAKKKINKLFLTAGVVTGGIIAARLLKNKLGGSDSGLGFGQLGGQDELMEDFPFSGDPITSISKEPSIFDIFETQPEVLDTTPDVKSSTFDESPTTIDNITTFQTDAIQPATQSTFIGDVSLLGSSFFANLALDKGSKAITKTILKQSPELATNIETKPLTKFLLDPYGVEKEATSKILKKSVGEVSEAAISTTGKEVAGEVGIKAIKGIKFLKSAKTISNFLPLIDIPIGAIIDKMIFAKTGDTVSWGQAFSANLAGEMSQLGITAAATAAGSVVPIAGNLAGGIGGFIVGTSADIAATEAVYKAMGVSNLYDDLSGKPSGNVKTNISDPSQIFNSLESQEDFFNVNNILGNIQSNSSNSSSRSSSSSNINQVPVSTQPTVKATSSSSRSSSSRSSSSKTVTKRVSGGSSFAGTSSNAGATVSTGNFGVSKYTGRKITKRIVIS